MNIEELVERYNNIKNKKKINGVCGCFENDSCGDNITFCLKIKDNKIVDSKFDGNGCVVSQITADELANYIKNKNISIIDKIDYAKLKEITDINPSTGRIKCMLAPLNALKSINTNKSNNNSNNNINKLINSSNVANKNSKIKKINK